MVERVRIGRSIVKKENGGHFVGAKTLKYIGKQKSFASQVSLVEMFKDVEESILKWRRRCTNSDRLL